MDETLLDNFEYDNKSSITDVYWDADKKLHK